MAHIYYEKLSKEYKRKLISRELSVETVKSLAASISTRYSKQKRAFIAAAAICAAVTALMIIMLLMTPEHIRPDGAVILFILAVLIIMEVLIFSAIYLFVVTGVPRQFSKYLEKSYPELLSDYGYLAIINGTASEGGRFRQFPFSLYIDDIFHLENSSDIVVAGYAHGLIKAGFSVYLAEKSRSSKNHTALLVVAIESGYGTPVSEAADMNVALRIKEGKNYPIKKGMYLYRDTSVYTDLGRI